MNSLKIKILFLIARSRLNQMGKCSIRCRITHKKERYEFATGLFIYPNHWYGKLQQAKPPNDENIFINSELSLIKTKINQAFLYLQMKNIPFNVNDIYLQSKGQTPQKEYGIIEVYDLYNIRINKLVGVELKLVTYKKYIESRNHLFDFVKWKFKANDYKFKELKMNFISDYEYYLKTEKNLQQSTLNKAIQRFRKVVRYAISQEYLNKDPFDTYRPFKVKKEVIYLSALELSKFEKQLFSQVRLTTIQDLFIFCCYTGLAFNEMSGLEKKHLQLGFDGINWIKMKREKTQCQISIPILPKAQKIINKYIGKTSQIDHPIPVQIDHQFRSKLTTTFQFKLTT